MLTLVAVLLSVEGGYRLDMCRIHRREQEKEAVVAAMVAAVLGLLALLLSFTFGLAASRFDARRMAMLDESNAIGTTYLRAGMLEEPQRTRIRGLLRDYVDVRLQGVREQDPRAISRSTELHARLWAEASVVAEKAPGSIVVGLFIHSLNQLIDLHAKRVLVGLRSRIPTIIWLSLYVITVLAFATMGYYTGLARTGRSLVVPAMALAFSVTMVLILDLDRPHAGLLLVNQQTLMDLRNLMVEPNP